MLSTFKVHLRRSLHVRAGEVRSLKSKTGYTEVEMYRKFLWYLLRERTFDPAAVQDTLHLKQALSLSDQQACPNPTPLHVRPLSVNLCPPSLSVSIGGLHLFVNRS